jgi:hypothetical protein
MANDQKHLLVIARLIAGALIGGGDAAAGQAMTTPLERAISTPRGQLRTPYPDFAKIYRSHDCNGCHGGGGGGGMAAPLTNQIWIYGDNDDTLFRVIALGTGSLSPGDAFQKQGFVRKGSENVVGPMPPFGETIKTEDEVWKIIAWIRSVHCERRPEGC